MSEVLIVPAAGAGSRLGGERPKLLAEVGGRAMIDWVLDLHRERVERIIVVIHPSAEASVRAHLGGDVEIAFQAERTGMLDAILAPAGSLDPDALSGVWVTWCDQVAMTRATVDDLAAAAEQKPEAAVAVATLRRKDPYIHFERDADGAIINVLQAREGDVMPVEGESDMGLFRLSTAGFLRWLPEFAAEVTTAAGTGERNFLPFLPWLRGRAETVSASGHHDIEALGVNTPEDRRRIEEYWARG
jgi:bifunctional UDP-N-acetylglucosamine pyrophosphorylase/glucosamine-1-phosphate N-acetyltransferase